MKVSVSGKWEGGGLGRGRMPMGRRSLIHLQVLIEALSAAIVP